MLKDYLLQALKSYDFTNVKFTKEEFVEAIVLTGRTSDFLPCSDVYLSNFSKKFFPNKLPSQRYKNYLLSLISKKHCNKCNQVKDYSNFHNNKSTFDKLSNACIECRLIEQNTYYSENSEVQVQRVRKRDRNLDRVLMQQEIEFIFKRDNYKCCICNYTNEDHNIDYGQNLHLDHIIPVSKGGLTTTENIRLLCRSCNSSKGNKVYNCADRQAV